MALKGAEAKGLGVHVQLGPVGGPLGKIPTVSHPRRSLEMHSLSNRQGAIGKGSL